MCFDQANRQQGKWENFTEDCFHSPLVALVHVNDVADRDRAVATWWVALALFLRNTFALRVPLEAVLTLAGRRTGQFVASAGVVRSTERHARLLASALARRAPVHFIILAFDRARCTRTVHLP